MEIFNYLISLYAKREYKKMMKWVSNPHETQKKVFKELLSTLSRTKFGKEKDISAGISYSEFCSKIPIQDYESLEKYIERIIDGEENVLWSGVPKYFAKTSGTTSGMKYIPISKESMPTHVGTAKLATLTYIHKYKKPEILRGKILFLQGSPVLEKIGKILTGRLSGIVAHHVPSFLQRNRVPTNKINSISDWEKKTEAIAKDVYTKDLRIIGGIPPWIIGFFEKLQKEGDQSIKNICDIFPNLDLYIYGGLNYKPYENRILSLIGKKIDTIELFPASEGFYAFQDEQKDRSMLLQLDSGIFYEFIELKLFNTEKQERLVLSDLKKDTDYVLIISTNAGLWAYNTGDVVRFKSLEPYRLIVTGRVKHYISAFGEHVIAEEIDNSITHITKKYGIEISEFTVGPRISEQDNENYYIWAIEADIEKSKLQNIAKELDEKLSEQNQYYKDLLDGRIILPSKIVILKKDSFQRYLKEKGKYGGQNKVVRLSNNLEIITELKKLNN